jgi:hypothetical protein
MNNRFKTDFLNASSSFLTGMGSVVNLRGHLYDYNSSDDPDQLAIAQDWQIVGQDMRDALKKAEREFEPITHK